MGTTVLMVIAVVIPASAASLLVLALDLRAHRRRPPRRWAPTPSRLTAALGAALGVGGFGLASVAGIAAPGHAARAAEPSAEQLWVATATAGTGLVTGLGAGQSTTAPVEGQAAVQLPFAPVVLWGSGTDAQGSYVVVAEVPGAGDVPLIGGNWKGVTGDGAHPLALLDPAAIVDAARAHGIVPTNGVFNLELRSPDPAVSLRLTLADRPAPVAAPAPAQTFKVPTTAVAPAARAPVTAAPPAPAGVGVPATGSGAPLLGGLVLVLAGGACAGLSLRLRRGGPFPAVPPG
jgi:hypothetical protein